MNITSALIITCYNYEKYVDRAIQSALSQTTKFDEIIFVDDGSTDDSYSVAEKYKEVTLVKKENGGQLSAFREGFKQSSGDIVCFLDCDDELLPDHLKGVLTDFKSKRIGMRFNNNIAVKDTGHHEIKNPFPLSILFSPTPVATYYSKWWLGAPTSCLTIERELLKLILDYSEGLDSQWKTRADDILVWGSSLLGAKKFYNENPTTTYHIHGSNAFHSLKLSNDYCVSYDRARDVFFSRFSEIFSHRIEPHKELLSELQRHTLINSAIIEKYKNALKSMRPSINYTDYLKSRLKLKILSKGY